MREIIIQEFGVQDRKNKIVECVKLVFRNLGGGRGSSIFGRHRGPKVGTFGNLVFNRPI